MGPAGSVLLDVFSDIVCPWCFIGKRRLDLAVESGIQLRWRAFELQPELPPEGVDAHPYYRKKFGGEARMQALFDHVADVARGDGITLDFERMRKAPNTRLAHRMVKLASSRGLGAEVVDACFRGHFELGVDIGNAEALLELFGVLKLDLDVGALRRELQEGGGLADVEADLALAAELGVRGVPFFVANRSLALGGAQPVPVLKEFLCAARSETDDPTV